MHLTTVLKRIKIKVEWSFYVEEEGTRYIYSHSSKLGRFVEFILYNPRYIVNELSKKMAHA